jgi:predicted nucleic acid-binding protein
MERPRLYLETTMFNYYFDKERILHPSTVAIFEAIGNDTFEGHTSDYAIGELMKAQDPKKGDMLELIEKYHIKIIEGSDIAEKLADIYIKNDIIPEKKRLDALHIASASINGLDYILSLNFKHINKIKTKRMVELINLNEGYKGIVICTPMEVIDYDEQ